MAGSPGVSRALPEPRLNGFVPSAPIHRGLVALKSSGKSLDVIVREKRNPPRATVLMTLLHSGCFLNALSKVRRGARGGI